MRKKESFKKIMSVIALWMFVWSQILSSVAYADFSFNIEWVDMQLQNKTVTNNNSWWGWNLCWWTTSAWSSQMTVQYQMA